MNRLNFELNKIKEKNMQLIELVNCIKHNSLIEFKYLDWLEECLHQILEYEFTDEGRPKGLLQEFYDYLIELFSCDKRVYHGFNTMIDSDNMLQRYKGLVSCSLDLETAYMFGTNKDFVRTQTLLIFENAKGFNLYEFLRRILNDLVYSEEAILKGLHKKFGFVESYLDEYEVLVPFENTYYEVVNNKEVSYEEIGRKYPNNILS